MLLRQVPQSRMKRGHFLNSSPSTDLRLQFPMPTAYPRHTLFNWTQPHNPRSAYLISTLGFASAFQNGVPAISVPYFGRVHYIYFIFRKSTIMRWPPYTIFLDWAIKSSQWLSSDIGEYFFLYLRAAIFPVHS
jgi:hypothetical protein